MNEHNALLRIEKGHLGTDFFSPTTMIYSTFVINDWWAFSTISSNLPQKLATIEIKIAH